MSNKTRGNARKLLKKSLTGSYVGYEPQTTWTYKGSGAPIEWSGMRVLKRIPRKIPYFFNREHIDQVRKTDFGDLDKDYYIIRSIDGDYLGVAY